MSREVCSGTNTQRYGVKQTQTVPQESTWEALRASRTVDLSTEDSVSMRIAAKKWLQPNYEVLAGLSGMLLQELKEGGDPDIIKDLLCQMTKKHAQCTARLKTLYAKIKKY